jgi:hypothetical protein
MNTPPWLRTAASAALGTISFLILLVGSVPAVLWAASYVSAVRASRFLGHWPAYGHPDPKDLPPGFWANGSLLEYALPLLVATILAGVPTLLVLRDHVRTLVPWPSLNDRPLPPWVCACLTRPGRNARVVPRLTSRVTAEYTSIHSPHDEGPPAFQQTGAVVPACLPHRSPTRQGPVNPALRAGRAYC